MCRLRTAFGRAPALLFPAFTAVAALGCERREPNDPSDFIAAESARVAYAERARTRAHVTCRCDAEGGLHVVAPQGSTVQFADEGADAQADIFFADNEGPSQPIRRTISLGFIGDNKLTESPPGNGSSDGTFYYPAGTSGYGGRTRGSGGYSGGSGSRGRGGGGGHAPR